MHNYSQFWDLDPETTYLNHGSFGPSPVEVRTAREEWSARLERQPMRFFCQQMEEYLEQTAEELAAFLGTKGARLALIDNATFAMNIAAHSIPLSEGDEVLLTDHEYGAVRNIWQSRCRAVGAKLCTVSLPFPLQDEATVKAVESAMTDRTKVVVVSHVTSATAAILPVQQICSLVRKRSALSVIDGPHAVAMLDLTLDELGCDFYCGSCHKWLCASFGSGFLWAHPRHHNLVQCPIVSWGGSIAGRPATWQDRIHWLGTRDPASLLSIGAALKFWQRIGLKSYREHAHRLITRARSGLLSLDGVKPLCTTEEDEVVSMISVELPQPQNWQAGYHGHPDRLQTELRDQHGIELPVASWNGHRFLRVSAHLYNTEQQIDHMLEVLSVSSNLR